MDKTLGKHTPFEEIEDASGLPVKHHATRNAFALPLICGNIGYFFHKVASVEYT